MFLGLEDSSLMKAYDRSMDREVEEYYVGIPGTCRQSEMRRQQNGGLCQTIVHAIVALPKFSVQVVLSLIRFRAMKMGQVQSVKVGNEDYACEG